LHLNETEQEQLQQLVNRHRTPQQIAIRASIVLLADEGQNHEICPDLKTAGYGKAVAQPLARVQWETIPVVERLQDAQRPGGPMTFSLEQILQLFAIACETGELRASHQPLDAKRISEVVKLGIVRAFLSRHGAIDGRSRFETSKCSIG